LYYEEYYEDTSKHKLNQPFILDLVTLEKIYFQTIPAELEYNPESTWAVIASPGRNNPLYQYTGGEDTLKMSLTWYADDETRADVLRKCKMLEALSKNNSYDERPHHIALCFGDLFRGAKWIVEGAPFKLSLFSRPHGMLPQLGTTELTLKRITDVNRTRANILKLDT
jgi:hypothetical protein